MDTLAATQYSSDLVADQSAVAEMAKGARRLEPGEFSFFAEQQQDQKPEASPGTGQQAAPDKTEDKQPEKAEAKTETKTAANEAPKIEVKAPEATQVAQPDWQEVLRQKPVTEVLKTLGLDESMVNFLNGRKSIDPKVAKLIAFHEGGGDLKRYLRALTTDYSKMDDETVMEHQLRQDLQEQGIELTPDEFKDHLRSELVDRFKLDPDMYDEKERKSGRLALKIAAAKSRNAFIKGDQEFTLGEPPKAQPSQFEQQFLESEAAGKRAEQEYIQRVNGDTLVKNLMQSRKLVIGSGDEAFTLDVKNPEEMLAPLFNLEAFGRKITVPTSDPEKRDQNVGLQLLMAALIDNPDSFLSLYSNHHQEIGKRKYLASLENASGPSGGTTSTSGEPTNQDPVAQMAKNGRVVSATGLV